MMTLRTRVDAASARLRLIVRGAVQGVGFRPFVFRLANHLGLPGWVNNSAQGVFIEVEGTQPALEQFLLRLDTEKPPHSFIQSCEASWLDIVGYESFEIRESDGAGTKTALVLPDIATCPECVREIFDPKNRRFRYPFTNCTHCGPRFSIIESLPYDRANTAMKSFRMCLECEAEYNDPNDRRFHAQPNACPVCGPRVELWPGNFAGSTSDETAEPPRRLASGHDAVLAATHVIRCGQIVAVKGIGGFHLLADARSEEAVGTLRERKHREEKPFAVMFPSLESIRMLCDVSPQEERLLQSPEAPIVLLRSRPSLLSRNIAPGNPNLGVMLPSNPLQHLLMAELRFPVVATSGNLSDEPICTDELEALVRLRGIANVLLVHNRRIVRHEDDSIVRMVAGRELILRRARGYAPLPIQIQRVESCLPKVEAILAVGAHLKNSVALAVGQQVFLSQHIGDLETEPANYAFRRAALDLPRLYETPPEVIAADLHPDYISTKFALERLGVRRASEGANDQPHGAKTRVPRIIRVQHHIAHVLSCIAENEVELPALGVAWDGTGYGADGTIWGGEFFLVTAEAILRVGHLRTFRLPGGDAAVQEPRRAALGILREVCGERFADCRGLAPVAAFSNVELSVVKAMLDQGLNTPLCSSMGRLFDAVAALAGLRQETKFEGQAAMELEFALDGVETDEAYHFPLIAGGAGFILDWAPMIEAIIFDAKRERPTGEISAKFHNALAEAVLQVANRVDCSRVVLSGGCFQNRYLTERLVRRLREEGYQPYWHQRVPTNDGGISLGQVVAAQRALASDAGGRDYESAPISLAVKQDRKMSPVSTN